jgi:signal transduction histidine kinase
MICLAGIKVVVDPIDARGFPETRYTLQVYADDCTGCALCVEACPAKSLEQTGKKAINMVWKEDVLEQNRHDVQIEFHAFDDPLPAPADGIQIAQVVLNLLLNGIQATAATEGRERRLRVETRTYEGNAVEVSVADNGPGIAPELHEKIFEQFFTTREGGLGMGLAISRSIVEAHEGRLSVESEPGQGSVFRFTLPAARVPLAPGGLSNGNSPEPALDENASSGERVPQSRPVTS